jgi:hypothetical protein
VQVLNYIRYTLEADAATRDASNRVDVERLFAAVELLIDRFAPERSAWVFPPDGSGAGVRLRRLDRASGAVLIAIEGVWTYLSVCPPSASAARCSPRPTQL